MPIKIAYRFAILSTITKKGISLYLNYFSLKLTDQFLRSISSLKRNGLPKSLYLLKFLEAE